MKHAFRTTASTVTKRRLMALAAAGTLLLSITGCGGDAPERAVSPVAASTQSDAAADSRERSEARIRLLEQRAAEDPLDVFSLNEIAIEHLQRARETGDVSALARAENALAESLRRQPDGNYEALALSSSLAVTQHDFARGLMLAQQAIALRPDAAYAYGVAGDAQLGLGRYDGAVASYAMMHEIEPELSSESRLALLSQTYGRHEEARTHWDAALALALGDGTPEHEAWVRAQIGALYFIEGDIDASAAQYEQSLRALPGYVHALGGLGRVAAARGDYDEAAARYEEAITAVPLAEYVIALGDVYQAAGETARAADQYELVAAIEQLYVANGVNLDLQVVLFNADHGRDLTATVARAEALFDEQPSIQAADALAWARYAAGDVEGAQIAIKVALSTGIREPMMLFHAGVIARAAGDEQSAIDSLQAVQDTNPAFSVRHAVAAREALVELAAQAAR